MSGPHSRRYWALARYAGLTIFAIPWIVVPIWLVFVNWFKMAGEAAALNLTLPSVWAIVDNYETVLIQGNYPRALANSLLVSIPTIVAVVLIGAAAAWGFGRSRSKVMQFGYYVIALSILIPPSLIPTIYLLRDLRLDGSALGYILVLIGTRMGVVVFLATGFVRATPTDIEDAACMDGANRLQIFFLIMLPLMAPVLFVGSVILLISVWGDFFFSTFLLPGTARATLPLALYSFATSSVQSFRWNLVFAHVVMSSLPLIIAYAFIQRRVISGLTEGALKG
jgi:raffinose/stachyose/melibiose transport system permease protein